MFSKENAAGFESRGFESFVRLIAVCSSGFALIASFGLIVFLGYLEVESALFTAFSVIVLALQTPRLLFHWVRAAKSLFRKRKVPGVFGEHRYVDYIGELVSKRK